MRSFGVGFIAMWSGALETIPRGWALCNGENGTPNLLDQFIVPSGDTYNPDDTGGLDLHFHDFTTNPHNHHLEAGSPFLEPIGTAGFMEDNTDSGITSLVNGKAPFRAVYYIMET